MKHLQSYTEMVPISWKNRGMEASNDIYMEDDEERPITKENQLAMNFRMLESGLI